MEELAFIFFFTTVLDTTFCYHPLGGIVLNKAAKAFGKLNLHENLFVIDGSLITASTGVNPFLTITALSEYCMENLLMEKSLEV